MVYEMNIVTNFLLLGFKICMELNWIPGGTKNKNKRPFFD